MLTKTDIAVLELFTSRILDRFTIREVSRLIKKDLKIVHTSVKKLIEDKFLVKEAPSGLRLNYRNHAPELAYVESARKEKFLKKNPLISAHIKIALEKTKTKFFVLLVFGSYASGRQTKKSDVDLLAIAPGYKEAETIERELNSSLSASAQKFHINAISEESFREMIRKRDEINVINETLNSHILIYCAETYYALLGERDFR